jgi:carbonic anhydrase/acetyltransferase-like protein (isoleucine patch superfamily)
MIMGSPAKMVRELTPEQIQGIRMPAKHYIENALLFQSSLKKIV